MHAILPFSLFLFALFFFFSYRSRRSTPRVSVIYCWDSAVAGISIVKQKSGSERGKPNTVAG